MVPKSPHVNSPRGNPKKLSRLSITCFELPPNPGWILFDLDVTDFRAQEWGIGW
jgi:hypothetical protein